MIHLHPDAPSSSGPARLKALARRAFGRKPLRSGGTAIGPIVIVDGFCPNPDRIRATARSMEYVYQVTCESCGGVFESKRKDKRFCSGRCRMTAHRAKK